MYVPIPGCPFTCTIIQPFLYDHLERNKGYVDLHRNVKVTFVPLVFLQIETDIIGSINVVLHLEVTSDSYQRTL